MFNSRCLRQGLPKTMHMRSAAHAAASRAGPTAAQHTQRPAVLALQQHSARSGSTQRNGSAQPAGCTGRGPIGQHARPNFRTSSHLDSSNQTDIWFKCAQRKQHVKRTHCAKHAHSAKRTHRAQRLAMLEYSKSSHIDSLNWTDFRFEQVLWACLRPSTCAAQDEQQLAVLARTPKF